MPEPRRPVSRLKPKERLQRVLALSERAASMSTATKTALLLGALALVGILVALYDPRPSLRHVRLTFLSGSATGNYFATVDKLAAETSRRKGRIANVASAGSVENVERLVAATTRCDIQFALVQDGIDLPGRAHARVDRSPAAARGAAGPRP